MKRLLVAAFLIVLGAMTASGQATTFYFPQIAVGVQEGGIAWQTSIYITNPGAAGSPAVSGTVTLSGPNAVPLSLVFVNEAGGQVSSPIPFQIPPGQTRKFVSVGDVPLTVGFATVTANGVVSGNALFSQFRNGILFAEAGVPPAVAALRQAVIVDTTSGFDTGVAFANPGTTNPPPTLRLMNTSGVEVLSTTVTT